MASFRTARPAKANALPLDEIVERTALNWANCLCEKKDQVSEWLQADPRTRCGMVQGLLSKTGFSFVIGDKSAEILQLLQEGDVGGLRDQVLLFLKHRHYGKTLPELENAETEEPYFAFWQTCTIASVPPINWHIVDLFLPDWHPDIVANGPGKKAISLALIKTEKQLSCRNVEELEHDLTVLADFSSLFQRWLFSLAEGIRSRFSEVLKETLEDNTLFNASELRIDHMGSAVLGVCHPSSDLDMVISVPTLDSQWSLAVHVARVLQEKCSEWATVQCCALDTAHPVVTAIVATQTFDKPEIADALGPFAACMERLGFPSADATLHEIAVDFSFNNPLAVENSRLMGAVIGSDPRVRAVCAFIKYWSKALGLNEPKGGTLSSYSWRIVALSFLMQRGVISSPREGFQAIPDPPRLEGVNAFWRYPDPDFNQSNTESVTELLLSFFSSLATNVHRKQTFHLLSAHEDSSVLKAAMAVREPPNFKGVAWPFTDELRTLFLVDYDCSNEFSIPTCSPDTGAFVVSFKQQEEADCQYELLFGSAFESEIEFKTALGNWVQSSVGSDVVVVVIDKLPVFLAAVSIGLRNVSHTGFLRDFRRLIKFEVRRPRLVIVCTGGYKTPYLRALCQLLPTSELVVADEIIAATEDIAENRGAFAQELLCKLATPASTWVMTKLVSQSEVFMRSAVGLLPKTGFLCCLQPVIDEVTLPALKLLQLVAWFHDPAMREEGRTAPFAFPDDFFQQLERREHPKHVPDCLIDWLDATQVELKRYTTLIEVKWQQCKESALALSKLENFVVIPVCTVDRARCAELGPGVMRTLRLLRLQAGDYFQRRHVLLDALIEIFSATGFIAELLAARVPVETVAQEMALQLHHTFEAKLRVVEAKDLRHFPWLSAWLQ